MVPTFPPWVNFPAVLYIQGPVNGEAMLIRQVGEYKQVTYLETETIFSLIFAKLRLKIAYENAGSQNAFIEEL